jgi:Spy/CpxP family protein refolding chaperone
MNMRRLSTLALATLSVAALAADPQPAGNDGGNRWRQRIIAENPELKDVDPNTAEGQERIRKVMQAQMAKRMGEMQAANRAKLKEAFAMPAEDFAAIEPLLNRVETLRTQQRLADPGVMPMMRGRGGPGGGFDPARMLGDTPLEPEVKEVADAAKALGALVADRQANEAEVGAALNRLRKARTAFHASLGKAQDELRSVLTPRQEAVLVDNGTLE